MNHLLIDILKVNKKTFVINCTTAPACIGCPQIWEGCRPENMSTDWWCVMAKSERLPVYCLTCVHCPLSLPQIFTLLFLPFISTRNSLPTSSTI